MAEKKTTRRYWLKLYQHYFNEEHIVYLESVKYGEKYILLWIKILLLCLKDEEENIGFLRFKNTLPYDDAIMAKVTRTDIDIVRDGMEYFKNLGMLTVLDNGTLYIEEVQGMVGSETTAAERMRKHREKKKALANKDGQLFLLGEKPSYTDNVTSLHNKESEVEVEVEVDNPSDEKNIKYVPLSKLLYEKHKVNDEKYLAGQDIKKTFLRWANDIRLLVERDKRDYETVEKIIEWCQTPGNFWVPNILSGSKLREKFATLYSQYKRGKNRPAKKTHNKNWNDKYSKKLDGLAAED